MYFIKTMTSIWPVQLIKLLLPIILLNLITMIVVNVGLSQVNSEPRDFSYKTIISTGYGRNHKAALRNAFESAVEQTVGIYIKSESEVRNYQLKKHKILSYAEGYINSYSIIDKYIDQQNNVVLKIKAVISNQRLYDALESLQILQMIAGNPTILVFFESFKSRNPRYIRHAINSVNEYLIQYRYNVVDLEQAEKLAFTDSSLMASQNIQIDLAQQLKADIYLTVDIIPERTRTVSNRQYVKAKLTFKCFESSTAKILGVSTSYSPEVSFDRIETAIEACIDKNIKEALPPLLSRVQSFWKRSLTKGNNFEIIAINLDNISKKFAFIDNLKSICREVKQEEITTNFLRFTVWYAGFGEDFIRELSENLPNELSNEMDVQTRGKRIYFIF